MSKTAPAFETVFDACQHQHRRIVLALLAGEQRSLTLDDIAQTVLEYDYQASPGEVSEDALAEVRLSLYHAHLPKLASEGLITHDPDRQLVEPTEQFERVRPTLATILDADPTLEPPVEL